MRKRYLLIGLFLLLAVGSVAGWLIQTIYQQVTVGDVLSISTTDPLPSCVAPNQPVCTTLLVEHCGCHAEDFNAYLVMDNEGWPIESSTLSINGGAPAAYVSSENILIDNIFDNCVLTVCLRVPQDVTCGENLEFDVSLHSLMGE